jgi:hypothetical protein
LFETSSLSCSELSVSLGDVRLFFEVEAEREVAAVVAVLEEDPPSSSSFSAVRNFLCL